MKRFTSIFLALIMLFTLAPMHIFAAETGETAFSDMKATDYYAQAATALAQLNIISGYPDGTYGAEKFVTRAEMAAVVCRMLGKEEEAIKAAGKTAFADVDATHWASGYINIASQLGIINGDGDGKFRPDDEVKYEEAIKMLVCAPGYAEGLAIDPDDWSKAYLEVADKKGIMADAKGKKGEAATRADIAVMSYNGLATEAEDSKIPATPVATIKGGEYKTTQKVKLTTVTKGADIYYTTDGTTPTVNSTKYTKEISISKTATLKAVAVKNGVVSKNVMSEDYTVKKFSGGGGGGSSRATTYTVTFDLNYEGATGALDNQSVVKGEYAVMPNDPEREGFVFMGWHNSKDKCDYFDFEKSGINSNITIYAQWVDVTDSTDTDGDGLTDPFEYYYGTDKTKADTDGDGLNDYFEVCVVNTDPLKKDSDNNGITDNLEDADEDKLTNEEEYTLGTNAIYYDTDHDLISDYDELNVYKTDPLKSDTDGDGVNDGDEIALGSNPLVAEKSFTTQEDFGSPTPENPVSIAVNAVTDAEGAGTLEIEAVTRTDNYLVSDSVAGYLGYAYNLNTDGKLKSATLTFTYDESLGVVGDNFQPRIYYLNEETAEFKELPNQTVTDGQVIVDTNHFSTYILLNKVEFDKVWETEIKAPTTGENDIAGLDIAFVIDSSGSMSWNDAQGLRKTLTKQFIEKMSENDRVAVIDFDRSTHVYAEFTNNKTDLLYAVDRIDSNGGTMIYKGINSALEQFNSIKTDSDSDRLKYMFVLTDGLDDYGNYTNEMYCELAEIAKNNSIAIYTIGLGNEVDSNLLKKIADVSGGKYYFASISTDLSDVFVEFEHETIDYITDSNNDGISDYYTKLINDGILCLTNTSSELTGCTDIFGEESADWDGDGLLNGEEIEVIIGSNGQPKLRMNSHPFWVDYDCDGYNDYAEVKALHTDPLKYSLPSKTAYDNLTNSSLYYACCISENYNNWVVKNITNISDWHKTEEAEKILIDYFYDYASEESINANLEAIENQAKLETIISGTNNILKIAKNIKSIADASTGISELDRKQEKVNNFGFNVFKGLPKIFECANKKDTETALELIADAMETIEKDIVAVDELKSTAESYLDSAENLTGCISQIVSTAKTVADFAYKDGKMVNLPIPKAFTKFSQKYTKWMESDAFAEFEKAEVVSMSFDFIELAANSVDLYSTYAKMAANTEAYIEYIEALDYISENGNNIDFIQDAAGEVIQIVLKNGDFMQELGKAILVDSAETYVSIVTELLVKNPYITAIKAAIDLGVYLSGITKNASATIKILMADSISDSFVYMLDSCIQIDNDTCFSVNSYDVAIKYLTQLAQSRIYGENIAKDVYTVHSVSHWLADIIRTWKGEMTSDEMLADIDGVISSIYKNADTIGLVLPAKLLKPNNAGGGGGRGAW